MASYLNRSSPRKCSIHDRLLTRELSDRSRYSHIRAIYGDRKWIHDLDIVNELSGHIGCVNALSWSKSGRLLASGSDDHHVNIHTYQPENSVSPFVLTTSVSTGHQDNIFSVKFMPHSNDGTLISCAGDSQVRVFDLEYSGRTVTASDSSSLASASRVQSFFTQGARCLNDGNTNARVYRSHSNRVKRIVTESSPHLFLTCSEDGDVRQWDLRQPSSAYPAPRGGRSYKRTAGEDDSVPQPLISYRRYQLELNTISCSPSQPHYIALGGAHQHCFLHDRRMLGRDKVFERAGSISRHSPSDHEDALIGQATQCVRRFGPRGLKSIVKGNENGHITACKISDAYPNEMIASWSGDWIYSFDLLRSPDVTEAQEASLAETEKQRKSNRLQQSHDLKRKRAKADSAVRASSKSHRREADSDDPIRMELRVQYENGQSERIPVVDSDAEFDASAASETLPLSEADKASHRIALVSVKIRKHIFSLNAPRNISQSDPVGHAVSFTSALGLSASILLDMDEICREWRYPLNPGELDVTYQQTLRRNRESARRFIQACGTLSRLLGGKLQTAGAAQSVQLQNFTQINPAPNEIKILNNSEQFSYDFIKAVTTWLDSGPGSLLEAFSPQNPHYRHTTRFPVPENASMEDVDGFLIPYLLHLAGDRPIVDTSASRFEVDSRRIIFATERAAVVAFRNAVKIPFQDLSQGNVPTASSSVNSAFAANNASQDRTVALRFWGLKVCRGVLLNAGEGVDYAFVNHAFGGLGRTAGADILEEERSLAQQFEQINPEEVDPAVSRFSLTRGDNETGNLQDVSSEQIPASGNTAAPTDEDTINSTSGTVPSIEVTGEDPLVGNNEIVIPIDDMAAIMRARLAAMEDDEDEQVHDDESENRSQAGESTDDEDAAEDGDGAIARYMIFRAARSHSSDRRRVNSQVPISSHSRTYRGHCNIRTVKDVNFFGLNDEYVVSGSDDHHLFIWDKRTSELLNILEGDGEVVNVIQGHPYEPMLAVSGIDHTIKIFSPDGRARRNAARGIGVRAADQTGWSSIQDDVSLWGGRRRRRPANHTSQSPTTSEPAVGASEHDADSLEEAIVSGGGLKSRKRMHKEYEITSQNDVERRGGNQQARIMRSMIRQLLMPRQIQIARNLAEAAGGEQDMEDENGGAAGGGSDDELSAEHQEQLADDCVLM